jgi:hypothetical protein
MWLDPVVQHAKGFYMSSETKKRFCSTGSHWTTQEFRKVGANRWICLSCYAQRKTELRNLAKNQRLARRTS